ncbi:MAG TPA: TraR/DksA C4-type zinc finger protein [Bacillota bacterium]|mgnify:CR=1 FL=1|nr:TraR/DksA C4-type zinc finger protein [Bacillota bacterium]
MREEKLMEFKRRLLDERKKLTDRIKFINEQGMGVPLGTSVSELSSYDNHPADLGTEVFERSKDFALRESAAITLAAVDDALNKMEKGTYGLCEVCGQEIAEERLEAMPSTTLCRNCKEAEEKIHGRPVEESVLAVPFARTFTDETDSVAYDGEDAWQDVARYSETTDEWSRGGSYYGYSDFDLVEDRGAVEEVDNIPYEVGEDGVIYKNFRGTDDEDEPGEKTGAGRD